MRVAVLVGSLRAQSFSRKIAQALILRAPRSMTCEIVEIGDLPLYNEDLEGAAEPAAWSRFRADIRKVDAVLFVTPEYNRSIPGCLKNAIDVGSRPPKNTVWSGKPAAVVSVTPYNLGAFGANHALRQTFVFLNMPVMQQPEAYIARAGELLDGSQIKNPDTAKFLDGFMSAFERWVKTVRSGGASDFEAFLEKRKEIAQAYVNGNSAPLDAILTRSDPATFLSPAGDFQQGAAAVAAQYERGAKSFHEGGTTSLQILQSGSGDLAFWTGFQHAEVHMSNEAKPAIVTLRITEVFRREEGGYKLVHRHADPGAKPKSG